MEKGVAWKEKLESLSLAIKWVYHSSRWLCTCVITISIIGGLLTLVEPYIFKIIIDTLVNSETFSPEQQIGIGIIGVLLIYGGARILQSIFWDINNLIRRAHNSRIEKHAIHALMANISSLDLIYFEDPNYYNTLTKATTNLWRVNEFFWEFTVFISEGVSAIVIISALAVYDPRIFILVLAGAIPSIILALKVGAALWGSYEQSSPAYRHAYYYRSLLTERPEAIKEIRSFGLREHFLGKFGKLFDQFIHKQDTAVKKELKWYSIIAIVEGGLSIIAAWLAVSSFMQGKLTIGELTFVWSLLFQFAAHTRWMVRMIGDFNTHASLLSHLGKVLKFKPTILEPPHPKTFPKKLQQGIEFRNVTFYYPRAKESAVKDISLSIKPNESIALVGENGSGKTTLIKLLARLYDVSKGEILIDGKNIREYKLEDLYSNIGIIFQDFMQYESLIEENIRFGRVKEKNYQTKVHEASLKAGAWQFIRQLEKTYKTHLGKRLKEEGIELSMGQWQKIALARAFFRDAQILILDEPTSAVDANAEYKLFQRFEQLTKGKVTILISHRFSTVRMAHKILVMDKGKIIEAGSHPELLQKNGVYAKMFRLQAKGYK